MSLSTKGRTGKNHKSIRVDTNDPVNPTFNLQLTGEVKQLVTITPPRALLKGVVGEKITQIVTLVPNTEEPLTILKTDTSYKGNFCYSMEETTIDGKKAFQFLIENTKTTAGNYIDKILILTDNVAFNPITIPVRGLIRPGG